MYLIRFSKQAEKDKKFLKSAGLEKKAKILLNVIAENPFQNPPPFEALVGNLSGNYSRRINVQHRLVYEVFKRETVDNLPESYEGVILVKRMWTHYDGMR